MRDLPVHQPRTFYHVGDLDPSAKAGGSYEGACLSVSEHPSAWIEIARLGGRETWASTSTRGRFLDVLALDADQRKGIREWAVAYGILEPVVLYGFRYVDDEDGSQMRFVFDSEERRDLEAEESEDNQGFETFEEDGYAMTEEAAVRHGHQAGLAGDLALDLATIDFVDRCTDLDGAWWNEKLDPQRLSAPRGALLADRMEAFGFVPAPAPSGP